MRKRFCGRFVTYNLPIPTLNFEPKLPHSVYKLKIYKSTDVIPSLISEFEMLYNQKYTHVANMPGKIDEILYIAKDYCIVCIDMRLNKFVAEFCSKNIQNY